MMALWLSWKPPARPYPMMLRVFELKGYIERRRPGGNQEEALRNFERAIELDPRNVFMLQQAALSYDYLRRYARGSGNLGPRVGDRAK